MATGLGLSDAGLVLPAPIPAAAMALAVDALLGWVSTKLAPAHRR